MKENDKKINYSEQFNPKFSEEENTGLALFPVNGIDEVVTEMETKIIELEKRIEKLEKEKPLTFDETKEIYANAINEFKVKMPRITTELNTDGARIRKFGKK